MQEELATGDINTEFETLKQQVMMLEAQAAARGPRQSTTIQPMPQSDDEDAEGQGKTKMTKYKKMPKLTEVKDGDYTQRLMNEWSTECQLFAQTNKSYDVNALIESIQSF
mmetsp:Transcript_31873/g.102017  ORF Transcript_31873/g.102017 Transcript_31873/m.102017 type:complete len:110 (-) Transcript_31873:24-353(-)